MKRTITKPDGSTEVHEGSPEELRRFDGIPDVPKPSEYPTPEPDSFKKWRDIIDRATKRDRDQHWQDYRLGTIVTGSPMQIFTNAIDSVGRA